MTGETTRKCEKCQSEDVTLVGYSPDYRQYRQMGTSQIDRSATTKTVSLRCSKCGHSFKKTEPI